MPSRILPSLVLYCVFFGGSLFAQPPIGAELSSLANSSIKVGVDLNRGGAIVYLSRGEGPNLVNNFDLGRQVQLSFFSGPVPFSTEDQEPSEHWKHLGWNPIQAGDDFDHASPVLEHRNDGKTIYVKTRPLQWPLANVPGECTFESWLELEGAAVKVRARLNNARSDQAQYPARLQELPAVYANAPYSRVVSYTGVRPFSGDAVTEITKAPGPHPWSFWQGTESWAALLDGKDNGLGLITPGRVFFTGGFAGKPGSGGTHDNSTGYLAGQGQEILDANITYEFQYELVAGSLEEIRDRARTHCNEKLPSWRFEGSRRGWHYRNASDRGWPIEEWLDVRLEEEDPQLFSPYTFWQAEKAPLIEIDAAFQTGADTALLFWQHHGAKAPVPENRIRFPIVPDGKFRCYEIDLREASTYDGPMVRLRLDPADSGRPSDFVRIRSIRLKAASRKLNQPGAPQADK